MKLFRPVFSIMLLAVGFTSVAKAETFECAYANVPHQKMIKLVLSNSEPTAKISEYGEIPAALHAMGWNLVEGETRLSREKDGEGYTVQSLIEHVAEARPTDWSKIENCYYVTQKTVYTIDYTLSGIKAQMQVSPMMYYNPAVPRCKAPQFTPAMPVTLSCRFVSFND